MNYHHHREEVTTEKSLELIIAHIEVEIGYINSLVDNPGIIGKQNPSDGPIQSRAWSVEDVQAYLAEGYSCM